HEEAQGSPAVANGLQVWRMRFAAIRIKRNGDFGYPLSPEARLDNHFGREFHTRGKQLETIEKTLCEAAEATINIIDWSSEHSPNHDGEHWIAAPSMRERHRSRHHLAAARRQATTLDQLKAFSKFLDELGDLSKVITIVRITHDDKLAVCRLDPTPQRAT